MQSNNGFKITATLNANDYYTFQVNFLIRPLIVAFIAIILVMAACSWFLLQGVFRAIVIIALFPLVPWLSLRTTKKALKKQFNSDKIMQRSVEYEFSEEGVRASSISGESYYPWDEVFAMVEQKNGFLLFESNRAGNYIPKRSFCDDGQVQLLRQYMQKAPERKRNILGQLV